MLNIGSTDTEPARSTTNTLTKPILYRHQDGVNVGELRRYTVTYTPSKDINSPGLGSSLWVRIKNTESVALRAAYLAGPYILYVDVRPGDYDHNRKVFSSAEHPTYEPQLRAGQGFYAELHMNKIQTEYVWIIDVVSQVLFSTTSRVGFEISIGHDKKDLHRASDGSVGLVDAAISVQIQKTEELWNTPPAREKSPVHLVVVTHGLHSNVGADMLYVKEEIDKAAIISGENIIVRGYFGNVCKTEKGIRYLGKRLANYIVEELLTPQVTKISFVAHSLGGLTQTYAIAHIASHHPEVFRNIEPVNFITLASPFLGISNENPAFVRLFLDIGFVGKTGQDLGLTSLPTPGSKPLLKMLPTGPTHLILKRFKRRTLYANLINDGIVPLRTSALLYLDWKGLSAAARVKKGAKRVDDVKGTDTDSSSLTDSSAHDCHKLRTSSSSDHRGSITGEIPTSTNETSDGKKSEPNSHPEAKGFLNNIAKGPSEFLELSLNPLQAALSYFVPQAGKRKFHKIYKNSQTLSKHSKSSDEDESVLLPPKTSVFESGISVLSPPLPELKFIVDPMSRPDTVFHDRIYFDRDLPQRRFRKSTSFLKKNNEHHDDNMVEKSKLEERIARDWHRDMSWRKVLVRLEPDAHNNIVVRRRFANAHGWPVIDHLIEHHFINPVDDPNLVSEDEGVREQKLLPEKHLNLFCAERPNFGIIRPMDILRSSSVRSSSSKDATEGNFNTKDLHDPDDDALLVPASSDINPEELDISENILSRGYSISPQVELEDMSFGSNNSENHNRNRSKGSNKSGSGNDSEHCEHDLTSSFSETNSITTWENTLSEAVGDDSGHDGIVSSMGTLISSWRDLNFGTVGSIGRPLSTSTVVSVPAAERPADCIDISPTLNRSHFDS